MQVFNFKRACLVLFFFQITACTKRAPCWKYDNVSNSCSEYRSAKLWSPAQDPFRGLEVELISSHSGLRMYVNTYSRTFPANEEGKCEITMSSSQIEPPKTFYADRLEGGQRLLLPPQATSWTIEQLLLGNTIKMTTGRYSTEVSPEEFNTFYPKFYQKTPKTIYFKSWV